MLSLVLASLVWALSFGLIKHRLAGCDPVWVAAVRLALAALLFAPWLRRPLPRDSDGQRWRLFLLGAVQFGLMYLLYIASYHWLPAWGVALLTVTTPLLVVLVDDVWSHCLRLRPWLAALAATAGAVAVLMRELPPATAWPGILLLQGANLCFAWGQVAYARRRRGAGPVVSPAGTATSSPDAAHLARMYVAAAGLALAVALSLPRGGAGVGPAGFTAGQWLVLLYLGVLPTGVGFWLWNRGAARVGTAALAAANNLKTPLAILLAWSVFGERADPARLLAGLVLVVGATAWASRSNSLQINQ